MVIPGIFEETIEKASQEISLLGNLAPQIQLDIADGVLVNGKTFLDLSFLLNLHITSRIQLHLMVQKPEAHLLSLPSSVTDICAQVEAFIYNPMGMENFSSALKGKNIRMGLSFNPQTPFEDFEDYVHQCDYVQFMTVNPGGQGRPFILDSLNKIAQFREKHPKVHLQVDGGISVDTVPMVVQAGANDVIVGSQIFKSADPSQTYKNFVLQFENARTNFLHSQQSPTI